MSVLPKYPKEKMKGNIGESLAQYVLSKFCLVHKIDGTNDVGNDFICELIRDQYPTNLLFYVQVKYTQKKPTIRKETMEYWKGSPVPVYLFWIKDPPSGGITSPASQIQSAQYKRLTPVLHGKSKKTKFRDFSSRDFKRDLVVDYTRTQYVRGATPIIKPRDFLTLEEKIDIGFGPHQLLIKDVIPEYSKEILANSWVNLFSTAILLDKKEDRESKELAKKTIKLALELRPTTALEEYPTISRTLDREHERMTRNA